MFGAFHLGLPTRQIPAQSCIGGLCPSFWDAKCSVFCKAWVKYC